MKKEINFIHNSKRISVNTIVCNSFEKIIGLMFKSKKQARALLFEFDKPTKMKIHSLFVFFPFVAIWLDDKNKIIDIKHIRPFEFSVLCKKSFVKLVEIPINKNYSEIIHTLLH